MKIHWPTLPAMRITAAAALFFLVAFMGSANAAPGVAIRWDQCYGDAGTINHNFACNANTGSDGLIASFEVPQDIAFVNGLRAVLVLAAASPTLPAWWEYRNAGSCRISSLTLSFAVPGTAVNCSDWASGQGAGVIGSYTVGSAGPNTASIEVVEAVPTLFDDLLAGNEWFAFKLTIDHAKTVGTGACVGCSVPVCIVLREIEVVCQAPGQGVRLTSPLNGTDAFYSTWQGGGAPSGNYLGCPAATPTRASTWGGVKALYR
jgi:hypothetical protein